MPEALVNYLALIGWSAGDDEILSVDALIERFSLSAVGHAAGVFDEEKLAWVNRHYLRAADPARIAALSVPFFGQDGFRMSPSAEGMSYLTSAMAMVTESVDRLDQVPRRLRFLFEYRSRADARAPGRRRLCARRAAAP